MNVFSLIGMFCMFYYIYHINHWQQKSKKCFIVEKYCLEKTMRRLPVYLLVDTSRQ